MAIPSSKSETGWFAVDIEEMIEAWRVNNRINLYMIDQISIQGMGASLSTRGGRDVSGQFAHMHNNRVWQLDKRAKSLATALTTFPPKTSPGKAELRKALRSSGDRIEQLMRDLAAGLPKRRGFRRGIPTLLSYFIAHENHHRGNITLTLKQSGESLDKHARYAIWDWDRI